MPQSISPSPRPNATPRPAEDPAKPLEPQPAAAGSAPVATRPASPAVPAPVVQPSADRAASSDRFVTGSSLASAVPVASDPEEAALRARENRRTRRAGEASLASASTPAERTVTFEYDTGGRKDLSDVKLKGSWNKQTGQVDSTWGGGDSVVMHDDGKGGDRIAGDGVFSVQQKIIDDGSGKKVEWGVTVDGPSGNDQWAVLKEGNLNFTLGADAGIQSYAPTTSHRMGVQKLGDDGVSFRLWLPNVPADGKVTVDLKTASGDAVSFKDPATGRSKTIELKKDEKSGMWSAELPAGWKALDGKFYEYKLERPGMSEPTLMKDPYSRYQQGQQRGVERVAIDNATGTERAWYWDSKNPAKEWGQLRYKAPAGADAATLRLRDKDGKALDRAGVETLLGQMPPEIAAQMPASWKDRLAADGSIQLTARDGAFEADLSNFRGIMGVGYELAATKAGKPLETRKGVLGDDLVENREEVKLGYKDGANPKSDWGRFEVHGHPNAARAELVLKDASGKKLTKQQILTLVGETDPAMRQKLGNVWQDSVKADGTISLVKKDGDFRTMIPNFDRLVGLKHELRVFEDLDKDGKAELVGDKNKDGKLSIAERAGVAYNDPNERILEDPSASRGGQIRTDAFGWKNDAAPRMATDPNKYTIYEAHVGTFFSPPGQTRRSTFDDMIKGLDYLKGLGVNTVELMPTSEFASGREWGYTIVDYFSAESGYGFEDKDGKWVTGTEALKRFIDAAHEKGFNVLGDVVYNHVGDRDNQLWKMGGPENPFFNWSQDPTKQDIRNTPWGALPAYNQDEVKQFFTNHAVSQVEDLHFDGLRFDFTNVMHTAGGQPGWEMLRQINKTMRFVKPNAYTTAEEFPNDPGISDPIQDGLKGAGFDSQWNDPFHDRLLENVQKAAKGQKGDMDGLLDALVHPGRTEGRDGVTYIHSHDEVGNTNDWVSRAADNYDGRAVPSKWAADQARNTAGLVFFSTGTPMLWQGEEFLANTEFRHGRPDTWGLDWDWQKRPTAPEQLAAYQRLAAMPVDQAKNDSQFQALKADEKAFLEKYRAMGEAERAQVDYDAKRWGTYRFYQDSLALRGTSPAFDADAEVKRVYSNNDNAVAAFTRKKGNDEFLVVTSFNKNDFSRYGMDLPPGRWQEVMNSDGGKYGGDNVGNFGATVNGGNSQINIPGGGLVVFKRVG